jgi:hypothetical protein
MTDDKPRRASTPHLTEERCNDILLGLVSRQNARRAAEHARSCPRCEALLQRLSAEFETLRSRGAPQRDAAGAWQHPSIPADTAASPSETMQVHANRIAPPRWRRARSLWLGGLAAAAVVVAVLSWPGRMTHDSGQTWWIPVESQVLHNRSAAARADSSFAAGLRAYAQRDAANAIPLLEAARAQDGWEDLRRVYLASALVHTSQGDAALGILQRLDVQTLPQPWRDRAQWVRFQALQITGRHTEADSLLHALIDATGEVGAMARERRNRRDTQH